MNPADNEKTFDLMAVWARKEFQTHSLAIFSLDKREVTSGTLVCLSGHLLVATCGHALAESDRDSLRVIGQRPTESESTPSFIAAAHCKIGNGDDVGLIELDPKALEFLTETPIPITRIADEKAGRDRRGLTLIGANASKVHTKTLDRNYSQYTIECRAWAAGPEPFAKWPKNTFLDETGGSFELSATRDIVIEYSTHGFACLDPAQVNLLDSARGYSGGGIWDHGAHSGAVWSPENSRLIGTDCGVMKSGRLIRGIQIRHWLALVAETLPDTKAEILGSFPRVRELLSTPSSST